MNTRRPRSCMNIYNEDVGGRVLEAVFVRTCELSVGWRLDYPHWIFTRGGAFLAMWRCAIFQHATHVGPAAFYGRRSCRLVLKFQVVSLNQPLADSCSVGHTNCRRRRQDPRTRPFKTKMTRPCMIIPTVSLIKRDISDQDYQRKIKPSKNNTFY